MKLLVIVLAAVALLTACGNHSVESATAVKSVDSATAAAPDTIKAVVVDTAIKAPADKGR